MSSINWANPVVLKVPDRLNGSAILRGAYGMDDWRSPSEFVVRLDHVTYEDGDDYLNGVEATREFYEKHGDEEVR